MRVAGAAPTRVRCACASSPHALLRSPLVRLARISRFSLSAYVRTRLLSRGLASAPDVGRWIAEQSTELGPLFVKLAQLVSARGDAVDPELARALSAVQDRVDSRAIVRPLVEGYAIDECERPLKAGSVASVWLGRRADDGARVVVKKLHEGVRASFEADLPVILGVLRLAAGAGVPGAANFHEIVRESEAMLYRETDMAREAGAMRAFRARAPRGVVVPRVLESGEDYIVQEYVPARKISAVRGPCPELARRLMAVFVLSVLRAGLVHGDPHPGNVGVLEGGALVLYDWGAFVDTTAIQGALASMLGSAASGDLEGFVDALVDVGVVEASGSDSYRVVRLLEKLARTPPERFHVTLSQQPEFADSSGRRLVRFGTDTVYLLRALSLVEGTCRALDPDFSYARYWELDLRPIVARCLERHRPTAADALASWGRALAAVPATSRRTLDATHQLNVELREEIRGARDAAARAGTLAGALAALLAAALLLPGG